MLINRMKVKDESTQSQNCLLGGEKKPLRGFFLLSQLQGSEVSNSFVISLQMYIRGAADVQEEAQIHGWNPPFALSDLSCI